MDDNELSAFLKAIQETHRNMMILHCRQSWEEFEMTIGYGSPSTTAAPVRHSGEGPAEHREISPLGLTAHTTLTTTARQLTVDGSQNDTNPATGRNSVKSKGGWGTEINPQKYSQKPTQGQVTGRAKERNQHLVDNPLDLTVAVSTQGASWSSRKKKSRDPEIEDTGHKSTGSILQAVNEIGSTPSEMEGLHLQDGKVNTPNPPDKIPMSKDSELITTAVIHSPLRQKDSIDPSDRFC